MSGEDIEICGSSGLATQEQEQQQSQEQLWFQLQH